MLPTSTQFREQFVPEGQPNPATARKYLLAPPSHGEGIRINGRLLWERCGNPASTAEYRAMMRKAIRATRAGEEETAAVATLDELEAIEAEMEGLEEQKGEAYDALKVRAKPVAKDVEILLNELSREHRGLARLLGLEEERWQHRLLLRVKLGVRGWENVHGPDGGPVEPVITVDGLSEASLNCIPEADVRQIAQRLRELGEMTEGERKN